MADQTTLDILLRAKTDQKSIADAEKDFKSLQRKLKAMDVDWGKISKQASAFTTELRVISDAAGTFARRLGTATTDSLKKLWKLSDQLEEAQSKANELAEAYEKAAPGEKEGIAKDMAKQAKAIESLTQIVNAERAARGKEVQQLAKLVKAQDQYQKKVQEAAKFDMGDIWEGIKDKISSGNFKGIFSEFGGGIRKSIEGSIARGGMEKVAQAGGMGTEAGAAEMASAAQALGTASMALSAAAAGFAVFIKLVKAASDHMTDLNKALIQGMGFANDMVSDAKGYRGVINDFRQASINAHGSMLKFGKNSEDVMKMLNAYAKESTGSLMQTYQAFSRMGNFEDLVAAFAQSAVVYGKALNMEAEEVAGMMGRFQSEMGYGASQVQDLMRGVVQSVATASMPMTKFMEIFKSVTPEVELYRNRLEDLTGTIKLLSKTMSPKDVKQFMNAFAQGFSGVDFKQRLKTVFVAGKDVVDNVLKKGFETRAGSLAASIGADAGQFQEALKSGERGMAALINRLQAEGKQLSGTQIGEAMKLASYEGARQKGGPLNLATALRGAGIGETYQILKKMSQQFGTGFDGLNEHVIAQLGISNEQYEALRKTHSSMQIWFDQLDKTGRTSSKSLNAGIEKRMKAMGKDAKDFSKLSRDDQERILFEAASEHDEAMSMQRTAADIAQEQVSMTTSISDKISNVIAFLLEKLYNVLQPILDLLDDVWSWLTGTKDQQQMLKEMKSWRDDSIKAYENAAKDMSEKALQEKDPAKRKEMQQEAARQNALAEEMRAFGENIEKSLSSGMNMEQIARQALGTDTITKHMQEALAMIPENIQVGLGESIDLKALKARVAGGAQEFSASEAELVKTLLGRSDRGMASIMTLGKMQVAERGPSAEASARAGYRSATQRPGWTLTEGPKSQKEWEAQQRAKEAADIDEEWQRKQLAASGALGAPKTPSKVPGTHAPPGFSKRLQTVAAGAPPISPAESARMAAEMAKAASGGAELSPHAAQQLGLSEDQAKAARAQSDIQTRILAAIEAGNSQLMGISIHADDIDKHLDKVQLLKGKFLNEIVGGGKAFKDMFADVLEDKLTMFLFALLIGLDKKNTEFVGLNAESLAEAGVGISTLAARRDWNATEWGDVKGMTLGARDFGGSVPATGNYRLQEGEYVFRRGEAPGKSTTINATINVNGAQDPQAVAVAVRNEMYRLSERH